MRMVAMWRPESAQPAANGLHRLVAAGFSLGELREVCEAQSGWKPSRMVLDQRKLRALIAYASEAGFAGVGVSDYSVGEPARWEGKGAWFNVGYREAVHNQWSKFIVYVARTERDAARLKSLDKAANHEAPPYPGVRELGRALQIPDCCIDFYLEHRAKAVARFDDDYTPLVCPGLASAPWQCNYVGQYFGWSLIHHYPCSWACKGTLARAEEAARVLRKFELYDEHAFRSHLSGVVVYEGRGGVHMIRSSPSQAPLHYEPAAVVSTTYNQTAVELRASHTISVIDRSRYALNGVERMVAHGTVVLSFN